MMGYVERLGCMKQLTDAGFTAHMRDHSVRAEVSYRDEDKFGQFCADNLPGIIVAKQQETMNGGDTYVYELR